jgi:hypothetical protein
MGDHIYVGGSFTAVNGNERARYFTALDATSAQVIQSVVPNNAVYDFEPNGSNILASGIFTQTGYYQPYLAQFPQGSIVPQFDGVYTNSSVYEIIPDGSGGYFASGAFTTANGNSQLRLVHVLSDGTLDPDFSVTANSTIHAMLLDGNDLYLGGSFSNING